MYNTASDHSNRHQDSQYISCPAGITAFNSASPISSAILFDGEALPILHEHLRDDLNALPSLIIPTDVVIPNTDPSADLQPDTLSESPTRTLRVHFRSRVRIASGRHRRQNHSDKVDDPQDYFSFSPSSSSGSPSSSISAPLRTPLDDEIGKPGWGTLGQRVALFAKRQFPIQKSPEERERESFAQGLEHTRIHININHQTTERTPLLNSTLRGLLRHDRQFPCQCCVAEDGETFFSRQINQAFGPWPLRIFNHHWWKWKLKSFFCWCCLQEDEG